MTTREKRERVDTERRWGITFSDLDTIPPDPEWKKRRDKVLANTYDLNDPLVADPFKTDPSYDSVCVKYDEMKASYLGVRPEPQPSDTDASLAIIGQGLAGIQEHVRRMHQAARDMVGSTSPIEQILKKRIGDLERERDTVKQDAIARIAAIKAKLKTAKLRLLDLSLADMSQLTDKVKGLESERVIYEGYLYDYRLEVTGLKHDLIATRLRMRSAESERDDLVLERANADADNATAAGISTAKCCLCLVGSASHVVVSCGHLCLCTGCHQSFKQSTCPMCRKPITDIIRVYAQ